jgi:hypothetical protein
VELVVVQQRVHDDDVPAPERLTSVGQHIDPGVVEHRSVKVGVGEDLLLALVFEERLEAQQLLSCQ